MLQRFSLISLTVLLIVTVTGCKKNSDPKRYFLEINIEGQTIMDSWKQSGPSDLAMGANLDTGIVTGVERIDCEEPATVCYRFVFETTENQIGEHDPLRLTLELRGSNPQDYHYYRLSGDEGMTLTIDKIVPGSAPANFGEMSGTFSGEIQKAGANGAPTTTVPINGSFNIPTIP